MNTTIVHSRLLPLMSFAGRRRMSISDAASSASWSAPRITMPRFWRSVRSCHCFGFRTGFFRLERQIVRNLVEAKTPRVLRDLLNAYFVELEMLDRDLH